MDKRVTAVQLEVTWIVHSSLLVASSVAFFFSHHVWKTWHSFGDGPACTKPKPVTGLISKAIADQDAHHNQHVVLEHLSASGTDSEKLVLSVVGGSAENSQRNPEQNKSKSRFSGGGDHHASSWHQFHDIQTKQSESSGTQYIQGLQDPAKTNEPSTAEGAKVCSSVMVNSGRMCGEQFLITAISTISANS